MTTDQIPTTTDETCPHDWKWIQDWEGDPGVINGVHHFSYWECQICGEQDDERDPPSIPDYEPEYD